MDVYRKSFLILTAVLIAFGLLMVQSSSLTSWPTEFERVYVSRHAIFLIAGLLLAFAVAKMPQEMWPRVTAAGLVVVIALLLLARFSPWGVRVNGAQRWLRFGPVSVQPSELAKIVLPLSVALFACHFLSRSRPVRYRESLVAALPVMLVVPLVFFQPDLGTAVFLVIGATLCFWLARWPLKHFAISALILLPLAAVGIGLRPYQLKRITGFADAWRDFDAAPYQIRQSLMALGGGGWEGVGLGRGWQKLSFLPEANTDFIFAVVGEELGVVGTVGIACIWTAHFWCGLQLIRRGVQSRFAFVTATTLLCQLSLQAALNVAVATAMVPPKGIAHPLMSYGGSNLVCSLLAVGIIWNLTSSTKPNGNSLRID